MVIGNYRVTTKIDWHDEILENIEVKDGVIKLITETYHLHPLTPKMKNEWEFKNNEFKNFRVSLAVGDLVLFKTYKSFDEEKKKYNYRVLKIRKCNKSEFEKVKSQGWQDAMRKVFEIIDNDWDE